MIYFDNNATTRLSPVVADAMADCMRRGLTNPASSHRLGRLARRHLEQARQSIARNLGACFDRHPSDRVILTSGATEANHLAIRGLAAGREGAIVVSSLEHPSVRGAAEQLAKQGREVRFVRAERNGRIDLEHLRELLTNPVAVAAVMLANHETGVVQPVSEAAAMCRERQIPLHCDAVQGVAKLSIDFAELGVDSLSLNAHKLHGPVGVGALLLGGDVQLEPLLRGGGQQLATRPGTESVVLAVGLAAAIEHWLEHAELHRQELGRRRAELVSRLQAHSRAVIQGQDVERLPQTTSVSFPGLDRQELLLTLDMLGLACSAGSACASGSSEPSPVLRAMGVPEEQVEGSLRLSLGIDNTDEEIVDGAECLLRAVQRLESGR